MLKKMLNIPDCFEFYLKDFTTWKWSQIRQSQFIHDIQTYIQHGVLITQLLPGGYKSSDQGQLLSTYRTRFHPLKLL